MFRDQKVTRRNNGFQPSKLMMATLSIGLLILLFAAWPFGQSVKPKLYKFKTLKSEQLSKLASQSDGSQQDYFRQHILRPFLRVRVSDTDGNRLVQQHIESEMQSLGWTVEKDTFDDKTPFGQKTFTNIIATQNPSASRRLVLACHFDSKYFGEFEFIGAIDSAVPCAMMIDIARLLNPVFQTSKLEDTTLQLLFFDGEEAFVTWTDTDSLYGSRHLAEKMERDNQLENIDVLVLLDLIGTRDTTFRNFFTPTEKLYERLQKLEMRLASEGALEPVNVFQGQRSNTYFTSLKASGGISDDHLPFMRRGVPILHLISTPFPSVWHKKIDNESSLDNPTINNLRKILQAFVAEYLHIDVLTLCPGSG